MLRGSNPAHATIKAYPPSDIPIGIYRYLLIRIIRQVRFRRLREWRYAGFANVLSFEVGEPQFPSSAKLGSFERLVFRASPHAFDII